MKSPSTGVRALCVLCGVGTIALAGSEISAGPPGGDLETAPQDGLQDVLPGERCSEGYHLSKIPIPLQGCVVRKSGQRSRWSDWAQVREDLEVLVNTHTDMPPCVIMPCGWQPAKLIKRYEDRTLESDEVIAGRSDEVHVLAKNAFADVGISVTFYDETRRRREQGTTIAQEIEFFESACFEYNWEFYDRE